MTDLPLGLGPQAEEKIAWARTILNIPAETPAEGLRTQIIARLSDHGFCPTAEEIQAIDLLANPQATPPAGLPPALYWALVEPRRKQVEQFAAEFFQIPPPQRRQRWDRLRADCQFAAPLRVRLAGLEAGLDVDAECRTRLTDADTRKIADELVDAFCLPPYLRVVRHDKLLGSAVGQRTRWRKASQQLVRTMPSLARLGPVLIARLIAGPPQDRPKAAAAPAKDESGELPKKAVWIVIFLVVAGGRACASLDRRPSFTPTSDPPRAFRQFDAPSGIPKQPMRLQIFDAPPPGSGPCGEAIQRLMLNEFQRANYELYALGGNMILVRKNRSASQSPPTSQPARPPVAEPPNAPGLSPTNSDPP